ncbi:MAG: presqualene diphosphate synthase HpnD [Burkholderia sp.]|nr:MAG: Presqualene diphosphate synthase [Burkholderia gladioli]
MAVSHLVVDDIQTEAAAVSSGSSFYHSIRILPASQRDALFQVYAFCRAVDDIADNGGSREERAAGLDRWRVDIDACYGGQPHASLVPLTEAIHKFGLKREDFHDMIDGMAMDAAEDICAPDEVMLDLYCDRVASSAGRLSVRIFGMQEVPGIELAHHLGRALQLTNILRDIDEDAGIKRCYLSRELLEHKGIPVTDDPLTIAAHPALTGVCATLVERALAHFARADEIMDGAPRAQVKAPRIMSGTYRCILEAAMARGFAAPRAPLRKPRLRMILLALRYVFF